MLAGKGIGIALVVSLMLNAFFAGSMLTHFLRVHRAGPQHHAEPRSSGPHGPPLRRGDRGVGRGPAEAQLLRDVVQVLGGPRDARALAALTQGRERMKAHRQRMEQAQHGVRRALAAEPYDEAELTAALAELREVAAAGQREAQETLVGLGRQLTAQERARLAVAKGTDPSRGGQR
jgi:uncharacterized membrane protein